MTDKMLEDAYQAVVDLSVRAGKEEKYHDALRYGIAAYEITRDTERNGLNLITLTLIHEACQKLLEQNAGTALEESPKRRQGKTACSFCGKAEPEVRLVAGPEAFICNECVESAAKALQQPTA